jgi:hypothetical protein
MIKRSSPIAFDSCTDSPARHLNFDFAMAEILPILSALVKGGDILLSFANVVQRYRLLPLQMLVAQQGIETVHVELECWRLKWQVHDQRPKTYFDCLWGGTLILNLQVCSILIIF